MKLLILIAVIKALLFPTHAEAARPGCLEVRGAYISAGRSFPEAMAASEACEQGESITELLRLLKKDSPQAPRLLHPTIERPRIVDCQYYGQGTGFICTEN